MFRWLSEEKVPLFVDPSVELPQLELMSNVTGDCTSVYSTGEIIVLFVVTYETRSVLVRCNQRWIIFLSNMILFRKAEYTQLPKYY